MKDSGLKIALINATPNDYGYLEPNLGILSIASHLIKKRIVSKKNLIVLDVLLRDPLDFLKYFKPDLVGLSAQTTAYSEAINLGEKIKKMFNIPIIVGGIHITVCSNQFQAPFDIGVVGEGEKTFFELVKVFSKNKSFKPDKLERIKGIVFRDEKGKLRLTERRPLISPLDKIPPIDWSLIPTRVYFRHVMVKVNGELQLLKRAPLFTSRGCPYDCVFCARKTIWPRGEIRFFSVKRVVSEVETLLKNYGVRAIHIWDDCFPLSKKRLRELIKALEKKKVLGKVVFIDVFARADIIDEEFLKLLKKMGVATLSYGFESGSDKILGYLKNYKVKVANNKRAVELTDKFGIGITGTCMFGSPNETKADMKKTLNFIKWAVKKKNFVRLEICKTTPYPGTKLWRYALKKGTVSENMNYSRLRLLVPLRRPAELFFKEKVTYKEYSQILQQARRLYWWLEKKNKKQKGATEILKVITRRDLFAKSMLTFDLIWQDFKNKRFEMGITRTVDKLIHHLFSIERLKEDLGKLKLILTAPTR